jgi:type VI secretion system secreted protein VgrG
MSANTGQGNIGSYIREISGQVSEARFIRRDERSMIYEFVVQPALAEAAKGSDYQIFLDHTVIEVIGKLLAPYPLSIDWRIAGPLYGKRLYTRRDLQRQHWESAMACFQRLCEHNGLFYWFEHDNGSHRIVIADTMGAFHRHGEAYETIRFAAAGDSRMDEEHIDRLEIASRQTAGRVTVVDHDYTKPRLGRAIIPLREDEHNPRETARADQEVYAYANVSQPLAGAMGLSADPNDAREEARFVAQVRMQALRCQGLRAKGHGNMRGLTVGRAFHLVDHPYHKANREYLVVSATLTIEENDQASHTGQAFRCETDFEIQPIHEYFRLPHSTPWPVQAGFEYAIVTGPQEHEIWVDAYGRVKCQLIPDRQGELDSKSFIWVLPMQPWQNGQMGSAFVPRVGSQVLIGYVNGNPDMPFIVASSVNRRNMPAWKLPFNQWVSGLRSRMEGGSSANHLSFVDTKNELQAQLSSDHGTSQLSLGFLRRLAGNEGLKDARGQGFELRTDLWGTLRAAMGLLISTHGRVGAAGKLKDMDETVQRLTRAREQHEDLSQLAQQHKAQDAQASQRDATQSIKTQNDAVRGGAATHDNPSPEMTRPDLLLASAAGLATTAADCTHMASQNDHAVTAGRDYSLSVGRSYQASVRGSISLFAYRAGMKFYAAKGRVELQAQSDEMALVALKDLTITSTDGKVIITASKEVWIGAGGSYIQIDCSGIINGSPGPILEKAPSWDKAGAASMRMPLPPLPLTPLMQNPAELYTQTFDASTVIANGGDGLALENQPYRVYLPDGTIQQQGMLNEGATMFVSTPESTKVRCEIGAGDWGVSEDAYDHGEPEDEADPHES